MFGCYFDFKQPVWLCRFHPELLLFLALVQNDDVSELYPTCEALISSADSWETIVNEHQTCLNSLGRESEASFMHYLKKFSSFSGFIWSWGNIHFFLWCLQQKKLRSSENTSSSFSHSRGRSSSPSQDKHHHHRQRKVWLMWKTFNC